MNFVLKGIEKPSTNGPVHGLAAAVKPTISLLKVLDIETEDV